MGYRPQPRHMPDPARDAVMRKVMIAFRVLASGCLLLFLAASVSLFLDTLYGAALTGLVLFCLPIMAFLAWPLLSRRKQRKAELRALAQRADIENDLFLRGDPRGVFGQYPHYGWKLGEK